MKSPNFTVGTRPKIGYVIHGTLGKYEGAIDWLCTPPEKRPVLSYSSAHYVVAKDGRMTQLVDDKDVAWHAGNVSHPNRRAQSLLPLVNGKFLNPNESFIGIELEWFLGDKITEEQYKVVAEIIKKGSVKNPIILCHKEITDYKSDFENSVEIVAEIIHRLSPQSVPETSVDSITPLLTKLTSQIGAKDYKGAKDTTSYLFNELTKKQ
jgi:hypothetical protein